MVGYDYFHEAVEVGPLLIIKLSANERLEFFLGAKGSKTFNGQNLAETLFERLNLQVDGLVEDVVQTEIDVVLQVVKRHLLLLSILYQLD